MCTQGCIIVIIPLIILICVGISIIIVGQVNNIHDFSIAGIAIFVLIFILAICTISSCLQNMCSRIPLSDIEIEVHRRDEIQYTRDIENNNRIPIIERNDSAKDIYSQDN